MAATAREEARFQTMDEYIRQRQNMVSHYIDTQSIIDLCEGLERAPGERAGMQWWEVGAGGHHLAGAREAAEEAVTKEDGV